MPKPSLRTALPLGGVAAAIFAISRRRRVQ
jgi:hypothetical protein